MVPVRDAQFSRLPCGCTVCVSDRGKERGGESERERERERERVRERERE